MLETALSLIACVGVVLFQALVHYSVMGKRHRREQSSRESMIEGTTRPAPDPTETDYSSSSSHTDGADGIQESKPTAPAKDKVVNDYKEEEEKSFDGDEPRVFFELLDQTGSEMVKNGPYLESMVREQIVKVGVVA